MISFRNATRFVRNLDNDFADRFAAFLRRVVCNEGIFFGFLAAYASQFRRLFRSDSRRLLRLRVARSATDMVYFRFIRIDVFQRVTSGVFYLTRDVRMDGRAIAFRFAQVTCFSVYQIDMRTLRFLRCLVYQVERVSAITRQLARLDLSIHAQRARAYHVVQGGSFQFCRYFAVSVIRATCGLAYLFGRQFLIFSRQGDDDLRYYGVNDLTSEVNGRACQGAYFRIARLSFDLRHEVALRTQCNCRVRGVRTRFVRFQGLQLGGSN